MGYKDKEKQKEYQRLWCEAKRKELLADKSCKDCESKEDLTIIGIKTHKKVSISSKNIKNIIENSIILCGECHFTYMRRYNKEKATTHNHSKRKGSQTYHSWRSMRERCTNPNRDNYMNYGGLGVTICPHWDKFENFLEDMGEKPEGTSLDRINPYGNYEPENCR